MSNLIHKRGLENSIVIGKAKKKAKIDSGEDLLHPFKKYDMKKNIFGNDSTMEYCLSYLSHIGSKKCTFKDRVTKCNCMIKLAGNENLLLATATLMCVHAGRSKETRDEFLTEWERNVVQYLNVFNRKNVR